jgi:hypothetical protein
MTSFRPAILLCTLAALMSLSGGALAENDLERESLASLTAPAEAPPTVAPAPEPNAALLAGLGGLVLLLFVVRRK